MSKDSCCNAEAGLLPGEFKVEAVIGVDDRGQMVLPKDLRAKADLKPGEKLALISCEHEGKFCCFCLMKTDDLMGRVKDFLGPAMGELAQQGAQS